MSLNDYVKAQKLGEKRYQAALSKNEYPYLPVLDELITNFHLPESTLLMLVSALAGKDFSIDTDAIAETIEALKKSGRSILREIFITGRR